MKRLVAFVGVLVMSFSAHAQQDALRPFVPPDATMKLGTVMTGQFLAGRTDAWAGAPDFFCRQSTTSASQVNHPLADGSPKCYARSLIVGDIGDAPELVIRRAGPDNANYNAMPQPVGSGAYLGGLYWQAWGGRCETGQYGYWSGCGGNGRTALIYSRTVGAQTGTSRAGSLHFGTTPPGNNGSPVDRLVLSEDGRVIINTLAGMREIEIGEADSCGDGYRCLRVAN
jgi:hypothetical protein